MVEKKEKNKGGRPKHEINENLRQLVRLAAAAGKNTDEAAAAIGISRNTLKRHYKEELEKGKQKIDLFVVSKLFKCIDKEEFPAIKFYLKSKMGWTDDEIQLQVNNFANNLISTTALTSAEFEKKYNVERIENNAIDVTNEPE